MLLRKKIQIHFGVAGTGENPFVLKSFIPAPQVFSILSD